MRDTKRQNSLPRRRAYRYRWDNSARAVPEFEILPGKDYRHAFDCLSEIWTKVAYIPRQEVIRVYLNGGLQNRRVFLRQGQSVRKFLAAGLQELDLLGKRCQPAELTLLGQVEPRFFQRITRTVQDDVLKPPEPKDASVRFVGGRKQDVGIQKQSVHLGGSGMGNGIRV